MPICTHQQVIPRSPIPTPEVTPLPSPVHTPPRAASLVATPLASPSHSSPAESETENLEELARTMDATASGEISPKLKQHFSQNLLSKTNLSTILSYLLRMRMHSGFWRHKFVTNNSRHLTWVKHSLRKQLCDVKTCVAFSFTESMNQALFLVFYFTTEKSNFYKVEKLN